MLTLRVYVLIKIIKSSVNGRIDKRLKSPALQAGVTGSNPVATTKTEIKVA